MARGNENGIFLSQSYVTLKKDKSHCFIWGENYERPKILLPIYVYSYMKHSFSFMKYELKTYEALLRPLWLHLHSTVENNFVRFFIYISIKKGTNLYLNINKVVLLYYRNINVNVVLCFHSPTKCSVYVLVSTQWGITMKRVYSC